MKRYYFFFLLLLYINKLNSQTNQNCFLIDYSPKYITAPYSIDTLKPEATPNVFVTINGNDTLGKVSNYIFGNAVAVWVGANQNNPILVPRLQLLSPTLIRFPGGSWSNIYFWNGLPTDIPDSIYDGTKYNYATGVAPKIKLWPQAGPWYYLDVDNYYDLRDQVGAEGLISVNYGYARYGLSADPIGQAAHLAANWVRYDGGRTKFWEVGNENPGPWEAGWMIDTTINLDGQPKIITGRIYGKHFKVFVDSMKAAAAEIGHTIYIGGIINHFDGTTSSNIPDRKWNEEFFSEVDDYADFYVIHNYFGANGTTVKTQVDNARNEIIKNINFIRNDIIAKGARSKPIAMTEWNCGGPDAAKISIANGIQAVVLTCEMLNNNFGMSCRWLVANYGNDGMFYWRTGGNIAADSLWAPRPDFYFMTYLQKFIGDHMIKTTVTTSPTYADILAYASKFTSGHIGVIVVNKGSTDKVVRLNPNNIGVGNKYYIYSLKGHDLAVLPQMVSVNNRPPAGSPWGPLFGLTSIPAWAMSIGDTIRFSSPARSVQFIMIDEGTRYLTNVNDATEQLPAEFSLFQNFPNPFNPSTVISYQLSVNSHVNLKVYDLLGREIAILVNEQQTAGKYKIDFQGINLPTGFYIYRLQAGLYSESKKMLLIK